MKKIAVIILWFLSQISAPIIARDFEWNASLQTAYQEIIRLKLARGKSLLAQTQQSDNGCIYYLESMAEMAEMAIVESKANYENFLNHQDERLEKIEALDETSPYHDFLLAEIHLHTAFIKLKYGHELKGANEVIKAYRLLMANTKRFPKFLPQQKSVGILQIVIGATPKKYQWVTNLLGIRGDITQGLQALATVKKYDKTYAAEAELFEYILYTYVLTSKIDLSGNLVNFVQSHPDNLAFSFIATSLLIRMSRSELALQVLKKSPSGTAYPRMPFMNYFLGEIYLQKGKYEQAIAAYQQFTSQYKGFNYLKDTYFKLFLSHYLAEESEKANQYLTTIATVGSTAMEVDKTALKMSQHYLQQKNEWMNDTEKALKKVQLATEGGYYPEGLSLLKAIPEKQLSVPKNKVEWIYRLGRIYHLTNDFVHAQQAYLRVIASTEKQNKWYYSPRSCLYLGNLYQENKDKTNALYYYQKALTYDDYEGSNGVEVKVKAALNTLGY
jgi:tetratricopeptide (TPR) repeat protein